MREIVRAAYGDATGHIFLLSALIGLVGIVAAAFLRPAPLRTSLDLKPDQVISDGADEIASSALAPPGRSRRMWDQGRLGIKERAWARRRD